MKGRTRPDLLKELLNSSTNLARQLAAALEEGLEMNTSTPGYLGRKLRSAENIFQVSLTWKQLVGKMML